MKRLGSKIIKRIFGFLFIMGCSNIFFNSYVGVNEVHAQVTNNQGVSGPWAVTEATPAQTTPTNDPNTELSINKMGLREILNLILKIIYLLLRPLLVVAGISLDNTMVYASIFQMDAPLRKFRNMMKNFANFTLGFMVLFAIIKSLLTGSGEGSFKDEKSPLGIIKKTLIAGILIQASRFLMAALVDLSTVATYAVGGLPLSVLKNTDIGKQKILSVNSQIDLNKFDVLNKDNTYFKVRYSTTYNGQQIKISPCLVKQSFVIGREFGSPEYRNTDKFENDPLYKGYEVCVLFGNQLVMRKEDEFMEKIATNIGLNPVPDWKNDASAYKTMVNALFNHSGRDTKSWVTGSLVNLKEGTGGLLTGSMFFDQTISTTIAELIDKSKGFVGPLVTIYASLLNFAQLTDTNVTTLGETSGIFLIKTGIAIALFFPLLALAVVLIARIALLWLFIVGSPFIIIKESFKNFIKLGKLDEYINFKSVLGIVFAPVVTVAALSISLIFMTALINGFKGGNNSQVSETTMNSFQIQPVQPIKTGNSAFRVANTSELEFENFDRGGTLDRFSRLIVNFFAIGLLRTILFAAIKANALGKTIGANIQTFGSNVFQTLPVLPFGPGGEKVGLGPATQVLAARPAERVTERKAEQTGKIEALFKEQYKAPEFTSEQATKMLNTIKQGGTVAEAYAAADVKIPKTFTQAQTPTNLETMFKAIQRLEEKERLSTAEKVAPIFGLTGSEWYTNILNQEKTSTAKTTIDAYIKGTNPKNNKEIEKAFTQATEKNKEAIEQYFSGGNTQYEVTTEDEKTYVVKRTSDERTPPTYTYIATEKTS